MDILLKTGNLLILWTIINSHEVPLFRVVYLYNTLELALTSSKVL